MRPRSMLAVTAAAVLLGSTATPAQAQTAGREELKMSVVSVTPAASSSSRAACNRYTRTQVCTVSKLVVTVIENRKPVGWLYATITQAIVFNPTSRTFREQVALKTDRIVGKATGVHTTLSVSCGNPCKASNKFPKGAALKLGKTVRGKITYTDNVKLKKVHSTASRYTLTSTKAGYPHTVAGWKSMGYRCDNALYFFSKKKYVPGCVIPRRTPTMTAMAKLPNIAKNIRKAQAGPGHYGALGSGHPLHRLVNAKQQKANREQVCGKKVVGNPPKKGLECDEFPFASAKEGGTRLGKSDRSVAWVPKLEQRRQGGFVTDFWSNSRVLSGDAFYVKV